MSGLVFFFFFFFFSSRRRHTRCLSDWSSDVCSSDLSASMVSSGAGATIEAELIDAAGATVLEVRRKVSVAAGKDAEIEIDQPVKSRSEERRVGKEWRSRW